MRLASRFAPTFCRQPLGFAFSKGHRVINRKTGDSSTKRVKAFREICGSPFYSCAVEKSAAYVLHVHALRERQEPGSAARQIWTMRRLPLVTALGRIPKLAGQPLVRLAIRPSMCGVTAFRPRHAHDDVRQG